MPLCEDPSSLYSVGGIRKSNYSQRSCKWPELKFHKLWLEPSRQLVENLHITNCWRSCLWSTIWKTCGNTATVSYSVPSLSVPEGFCNLVCIAGVQWRSSFVFRSTGISSNSSISFCWLTSVHRSWLRILRPTNCLSCESQITPVFRTNLEILS